jgi:hypothetical protein
VVEVRYDHVSGQRFRHGTRLLRFRPDKAPEQCTFQQIAPAAHAPDLLRALRLGTPGTVVATRAKKRGKAVSRAKAAKAAKPRASASAR